MRLSRSIFREDIAERVRANLDFMPPDTLKQYNTLKKLPELKKMEGLETLPNEYKELIEAFLNLTNKNYTPIYQALEGLIDNVINMLYEYILTGEAGEIPLDWSMQVITTKNSNKEIKRQTDTHPRSLDRKLRKIVHTGIPLTLTDREEPLPPLVIGL